MKTWTCSDCNCECEKGKFCAGGVCDCALSGKCKSDKKAPMFKFTRGSNVYITNLDELFTAVRSYGEVMVADKDELFIVKKGDTK